jgi:hypothetical protein
MREACTGFATLMGTATKETAGHDKNEALHYR